MLNFEFFFLPNDFGLAHGTSVKLGFRTFHKLLKKQKIFDFTGFWLPY